jgi:hypothetical protein
VNKMVMEWVSSWTSYKEFKVMAGNQLELWAWWLWILFWHSHEPCLALPRLLMVTYMLLSAGYLVLKKSPMLWLPFTKLLDLSDANCSSSKHPEALHMLWVYSLHTHAINSFKNILSLLLHTCERLLLNFKGLDLETCCNPYEHLHPQKL